MAQLNLRPKDGLSWEDVYSIDATDLTNADRDNFHVALLSGGGHSHAEATYTGTSALTLAEFNAFEIGSTINAVALTLSTLYTKKSATVWMKNESAAV